MLKALVDFLFNRKGHPTQHDTPTIPDAPVAPYKVETPEPAKCGCGRSSTGFCVGLHKLSETDWASHPDNKAKVEVANNGTWPFPSPVGSEEKKPAVKAKTARTKKAPVAAITAAEKPATAKKPAKPRAKKAPSA